MGLRRASALAVVVAGWLVPLGCHRPPAYPPVFAEGEWVRIPLAELADGDVHFYSYAARGKDVRFLVRTDGSGRLQAHLDACFSCYRYDRGFVVEGDELVCIACRLAYPIGDETWDFVGACAPVSIHSEVAGGALVIARDHLERAARYF